MPSIQQQAIKMTKEAVNGLFKTAGHVPADKQNDWKPMGEARSTLSQVTECALTPHFFVQLLKGESIDFASPEADAKRKQAEAAITSIEIAEEAARKNYEMFYAVIAEIPDSALDEEHSVPWNPTEKVTTADVLFFPYWNIVYHIGAINYIQLLLGDTDMHMG
jgi:hypothetical protein